MLTKNVCIVLRNIKNSLSSLDYLSVTDAFLSGGYCFQEIRLLSYEERTAFTDAVASLKKTADNLAVVADRTILFQVREWLSELFDGESYRVRFRARARSEKTGFPCFSSRRSRANRERNT